MSGEKFCLDINEEYIERCGEIFHTNMNKIVIHCTMCEDKFRSFEEFSSHTSREHNNNVLVLPDPNVVDGDAEIQSNRKTNESFTAAQQELMEDEIIDMFDLSYLENDLNISDFENFLSDIELFCKSTTDSEATPINSGTVLEIREVRKCNIQDSIDEERLHKCIVCGLGFKDKNNMLHHVKRHSNERKHECMECNKKFYTGYELRIHTEIHVKKRPFSCQECERSFRTNALLMSHKKRHTNQRDYKCEECGKEFYEKRNLQEHILIHGTERIKFSCALCDAVFLLRKSLLRHKRTHENRKILKCEICAAVFAQHRGLSTHMKKKHKEL